MPLVLVLVGILFWLTVTTIAGGLLLLRAIAMAFARIHGPGHGRR